MTATETKTAAKTVTLEINGRQVQAQAGATILEAARQAGVRIPTLRHLSGLFPRGACSRNLRCELQSLAAEYNIHNVPFQGKTRHHYIDFSSPSIVRDPDKCILCGRCVRVCEEVQGVSAIDFTRRGFDTMVLPAFEKDLSETTLVNCGQCVLACPVGALHESSDIERLISTMQEGKKILGAQPPRPSASPWASSSGCRPGPT